MKNLTIIMRGAGDLATGVALRLHRSGFRRLLLLETEHPLAVRRLVSFSEAITIEKVSIENVTAMRVNVHDVGIPGQWPPDDTIPIIIDPSGKSIQKIQPHIVIDAIIAKRNLGTGINDAELVIGLGPGFTAGKDVNCVIETKRGHNLGRVIYDGTAAADTGIPGNIGGYTNERLLRAPNAGIFKTNFNIGDKVEKGECLAMVDSSPVIANISGVIRGLLRSATPVDNKTKLGDIDPRGKVAFCTTASDKAMAVAGGVLEAILHKFNRI
ncbi:MAG: EF2563 family selenium-dependent molybdenum hydroxylase system protein [Desulfocapsa sp.]|nr:EF2563 family selenium-dependent molybdenum hydroxylase system protein [Desulfocapsa sp.]MBN4058703.1 EF2563 family selenium-dependent molybdenum hydroxylase system protein [Desulfocapsa sp. AH-315-J15]